MGRFKFKRGWRVGISDLVYAHLACPRCGESTCPLQAWVSPCDFDEDGHADGLEICTLRCARCGVIGCETDEQCEKVEAVVSEIEQALWQHKTSEVGTIHEYWPGLGREQMVEYAIDWEHGKAHFFAKTQDDTEVLAEFTWCAECCFGIRKSLGRVTIEGRREGASLPEKYQGKGATHLLVHWSDPICRDEILFDANYQTDDGEPWKLRDEHGDWCTCAERGKAELSCKVHHFDVENHDEVCDCHKRAGARERHPDEA